MTDGTRHDLTVKYARGSAQRPMSDAELEEKFRINAHAWNPDQNVDALIQAIWDLDNNQDAGAIMALTIPREAQPRSR
jgi:2-methylcitrate dehydratase PrpD